MLTAPPARRLFGHKSAEKPSSFQRSRRSTQQGFTFLELVFVIVIISTLVSMLLIRVLPAIDAAEQAAVLKLEGQLRSALSVEAAVHLANGETDAVRQMQGTNPLTLMLDLPRNYVGEVDDDKDVARGNWFFLDAEKELVYRPEEARSEKYRTRAAEDVAFTVEVAEATSRGRTDIYGVRLKRVRGEDWLKALP